MNSSRDAGAADGWLDDVGLAAGFCVASSCCAPAGFAAKANATMHAATTHAAMSG
ncbi:MAG TPA: hypothetical protein PLV92_20195 [Pirellulaceae bacterium]|nr:hypothetical protein [Pirellulaceae bacterium]